MPRYTRGEFLSAAGIAVVIGSMTVWAWQVQTPPGGRGSLTVGNSSIAGTVRNDAGEALAGLTVRAIERLTPPAIVEARYLIRSTARTTATGEYRLTGLGADSYLVDIPLQQVTIPVSVAERYAPGGTPSAANALFLRIADSFGPPPSSSGARIGAFRIQTMGAFAEAPRPRPPLENAVFVYPSRFFPSASTIGDARIITLGASEQFKADLVLPAVHGRRVSGRLVGRIDETAHLGVRLVPADDNFHVFREQDFQQAATITDEQGAFTLLGVPPGQYALKVLFVPSVVPGRDGGPPARVGARGGGAPTPDVVDHIRWAEAALTVADVDIDNLAVPLRQPVRVSGRLDLGAETAPATISQATISLTPSRPAPIPPPLPRPVGADGTFAIYVYGPGSYSPVIAGLPRWRVQSILLGTIPITGNQLRVPPEGLEGLTFSMTTSPGPGAPVLRPSAAPGNAPGPPSNPDNGFVAGRVIDGVTGEPVRGATVAMVLGEQRRAVAADETGSFSFGEATAGSYFISADAPGYAPGAFGRMRPDGDGSNLGLAARERVTTLIIRMWKFGHVAGRVMDSAGRPIPNASVLALFVRHRGEVRMIAARSRATTDPNGAYRISNLFPGDHVVCAPFTSTTFPESVLDAARRPGPSGADVASRLAASRGPRLSGDGVRLGDLRFLMNGALGLTALPSAVLPVGEISTYRFSCHGLSAALADADLVRVQPGEVQTGIDLRLTSGATTSLSGVVRGPDGPVAFLGLRLLPLRPDVMMINEHLPTAAAASDVSGAFTFLGVPPGQYSLRAYTAPPLSAQPALDGSYPGVLLWAEQPVTVPAEGLKGLEVTVRPTARIEGTVRFDGAGTPPAASAVQVRLTAEALLDPPLPAAVQVRADGTFTLQGYAPGTYTLYGTAGLWGASLTIDGKPVPGRRVTVAPTDLKNVDLTMTDRYTDVSGRVTAPGRGPIGVTVFVFPADYRRWLAEGASLAEMRAFRPSSNWNYRATWLPPGDYLVLAYPEADGSTLSTEFVERLAKLAAPVSLVVGQKTTLDLTIASIR
jgi:hypothetical protein